MSRDPDIGAAMVERDMLDTPLDTEIAPAGVATRQMKSLCLVLDEDIVNGLERLRNTLGFPIEAMLAESLRPIIKTFIPIADLHQNGKLSVACLPDIQQAIEYLMVKTDVAKAHFDRETKTADKQRKAELRVKR